MTDRGIAKLWLQQEFNRRRAKNKHYSMRAFANLLEIPSGRLSEVLSGKRALTLNLGKQITERLGYAPEQKAKFLECIAKSKKRNIPQTQPAYELLSQDAFHMIADWYHYAILSLVKLSEFKEDPRWISKRLGISTVEVRVALDRLERLELLKHDDNGRLVRTGNNLTTTRDISSPALRRSHKQSLEQAIAALEEVPVEERDITSITMPMDTGKMPQAKELIRQFRRDLANFVSQGSTDEVFNLNIQLVPVTRKIKGTNNQKGDGLCRTN